MKSQFWCSLLAGVVALALSSAPVSASSLITLDYSSLPSKLINFAGDSTFSFNSGANFQIDSVQPGPAAPGTVGLTGSLGGTFTIGTVAGTSSTESAAVTGTGSFSIDDGNGFNLTGILKWLTIDRYFTSDALNIEGNINLTGLTYGGTNSDLLALASPGSASTVLNFIFNPKVTLTQLKTEAHSASFSGSVSNVPVPAAAWLFGSALVGMIGLSRRRTPEKLAA